MAVKTEKKKSGGKYGSIPGAGKFSKSTLDKVYRRGQGAFLSAGSRRVPMAAWSMGRVNSFLRGSIKHDLDLRKKKRK